MKKVARHLHKIVGKETEIIGHGSFSIVVLDPRDHNYVLKYTICESAPDMEGLSGAGEKDALIRLPELTYVEQLDADVLGYTVFVYRTKRLYPIKPIRQYRGQVGKMLVEYKELLQRTKLVLDNVFKQSPSYVRSYLDANLPSWDESSKVNMENVIAAMVGTPLTLDGYSKKNVMQDLLGNLYLVDPILSRKQLNAIYLSR